MTVFESIVRKKSSDKCISLDEAVCLSFSLSMCKYCPMYQKCGGQNENGDIKPVGLFDKIFSEVPSEDNKP